MKAAATIYGRVTDLYGGHTPTPAELIATDPEELRKAGLSYAKASLPPRPRREGRGRRARPRGAPELADEEVSATLTQVKGLGQWTVDMFLMFHLGRPDILPVGDLGIRNAARAAYGLRKLPNADRLKRLARPWRPYRTLACLYLWESLDNAPA